MRNWILKIVIAFIVLISFANVSALYSETKIVNGGFENLTILPWTSNSGSTGLIYQTPLVHYSGSKSARIGSNGYEGNNALRQYVSVEEGKTYELSAWVKSALTKGYCGIDFFYSPLLDSSSSEKVSGLSDWTYVTETATMDNINSVQARLVQEGNANGICWFDDVQITEVGAGQPEQDDELPSATFSASPTNGFAPLDVTFDIFCQDNMEDDSADSFCRINFGTNVELLGGDIQSGEVGDIVSSYTWDSSNFGSWGSTEIEVRYGNAGSFTASLRAKDSSGNVFISTSRTIAVDDEEQSNQSPSAFASVSPSSGNAPLTVTNDASCFDDFEDNTNTNSACTVNFGGTATIVGGDVPSSSIGINTSSFIFSNLNGGTWGDKTIIVRYSNSGTFNVRVTAKDNAGLTTQSVSRTVTVTDSTSNTAPTLSGIPDATLLRNSGFNSNVVDLFDFATDLEDSESQLSFRIVSESNANLVDCSISSGRYVDCDVSTNSTGSSTVVVEVEDTDGSTDTDSFVVRVEDEASEFAPVFSSINDLFFTENQSAPGDIFRIENFVSDLDDSDSELTFTSTATNNSLISCSIRTESSTSRFFNCSAPSSNDTGTNTITLRATDPQGNSDTETFSVFVESEGNQGNAPIFSGFHDITLEENQEAELRIFDLWSMTTDNDTVDDRLDFSITQSDPNLVNCFIEDDAGFERWFSCNAPKDDRVGTNTIRLTARDPEGHSSTETFDVRVVSDNGNGNDGVCGDLDIQTDDVRVSEGRSRTFFIEVRNRSNDDFEIQNINLVGTGPFNIVVENADELEGNFIDAGDSVELEIVIDADNVGSSQTRTVDIELEGEFDNGDVCRRDDASAPLRVTVVNDGGSGGNAVCDDLRIDDSEIFVDENDRRTVRIDVENNAEQDFRINGIEVIENESFFEASEGSFSSRIDSGDTGFVEIDLDTDSVSSDRSGDVSVRIRGSFDNGESCSSNDIEQRIDVTVENSGGSGTGNADFDVELRPENITLNKGQSKTVIIQVTNNRNATECFDVSLERSTTKLSTTLESTRFCIGSDFDRELDLTVKADSSISNGNYSIDVEVKNRGRTETQTLDVKVGSSTTPTPTPTPSPEPIPTANDLIITGVPITIDLNGNVSKEFSITIENPTRQGFTNLVITMKNLPEGVFFEPIVRSKLNPKETITVAGRIETTSPATSSFNAPLEISTDQGNFVRNIKLNVQAPQGQAPAVSTGFVSLLGTIGIGALLLIGLIAVIVVIVVLLRN